ncbi:MAG TPA: hypothetical protein VGO93_12850 [Candidatus Xenobia bacterium]
MDSISRVGPSAQSAPPPRTTPPGPVDTLASAPAPDPQLAAARQLASKAAAPVEHLHDGLERETAEGREITANPDTQMVRIIEKTGDTTWLVPTYRTALVYAPDGHPVQQLTGVEIHQPKNGGQLTAKESISRTPFQVTQDPQTHHFRFTTDEQRFEADPASMNVYVDGQEVHLLPDDPDVMQALEVGRSIVARGTLPDGNLQHRLSDDSVLTYNRQFRIIRQDQAQGTCRIMVPAVAMGGTRGGVLLTWQPQKGLAAVDLDTKAPVPHNVIGDPTTPTGRFVFLGQDGHPYALDPYHLSLEPLAPPPPPPHMPAPAPVPQPSSPAPSPAMPSGFGPPGGTAQQRPRIDIPPAATWDSLFPHATQNTFGPSLFASAWTNRQ